MKVSHPQRQPIERMLVVMPTWLGDSIMATPTLRALRLHYPQARITALIGRNLRALLDPCPWVDRVVTTRTKREPMVGLARRLSTGGFDAAVLLPNSFRSALLMRLAGIKRRIGYDRDGRGALLTDRLIPRRGPTGFVPVPTRDYYLGIAQYLGAASPDVSMELMTRAEDQVRADAIWQQAGVTVDVCEKNTGGSGGGSGEGNVGGVVLLNPGSAKAKKCWPAERFAAVADRMVREHGAKVAVTGAPNERAILDAVLRATNEPVIDLTQYGLTLRLLKSVIKRADVLITNDTGTRHLSAAMDVPVVTLFGPTTPDWTEIDYPWEVQVQGPTLESITVDEVCAHAAGLMGRRRAHEQAMIASNEQAV